MPRSTDFGSLTKELPLATLDATIEGVTPGMPYRELLEFGRQHTDRDAPGLVRKRFLLLDSQDRIVYDRFLSLAASQGLQAPQVRKVMYFVWAFRDERLRGFICKRIANRDGKWRVRELTKKANADFFKRWSGESSTHKVRSNIEHFFLEAGIYRAEDRSIHLELDDGWLPLAMNVAAQHERNRTRRLARTRDPIGFLIGKGWQALANATPEELRRETETVPFETAPFKDEEITSAPTTRQTGRRWAPRRPASSGGRATTAIVNHVARERAAASHQMLERLMARAAVAKGHEPHSNQNIDMDFLTPHATILAEMKSCQQDNLHAQVRRGVSQLLEYRFVYSGLLGATVIPVLVIETKPPSSKRWLVDYLDSLGITLIWKDSHQDRLVTTATIVEALHEIAYHCP